MSAVKSQNWLYYVSRRKPICAQSASVASGVAGTPATKQKPNHCCGRMSAAGGAAGAARARWKPIVENELASGSAYISAWVNAPVFEECQHGETMRGYQDLAVSKRKLNDRGHTHRGYTNVKECWWRGETG
jgi:hypothetical protein